MSFYMVSCLQSTIHERFLLDDPNWLIIVCLLSNIDNCFESLYLSSYALHYLIRLCWVAFNLKNYFVIIYLLEDEQELSLGMLIRVKYIYNFLLLHATFISLLHVFTTIIYIIL